MTSYKLTYFDLAGLGEVMRFLFAYGNIEYEDNRINPYEWYSIVKPTIYWGQLPTLEIDGVLYHQSLAISRYLAKLVGIAGKDDMEDLQINIALDTVHEYRIESLKLAYEMDPVLRPVMLKTLYNEYLPNILTKLDGMVKENDGYFALGRLTVADIYFVAFAPYLKETFKSDIYKNYDNLMKVISNIECISSIKKWIEMRPKKIAFDFEKYLEELAEMRNASILLKTSSD